MPTHDHALVIGKFAPLHIGHQHLIASALDAAHELTVIVWSNPDYDDMPNEVRAGWVRELYPHAYVIVGDDGPPNAEPDEVHRRYVAELLDRHERHPDVVVTGESYGPGLAQHLGISHVGVDRAVIGGASGTSIRADVHEQRHLLDPVVYRHFVDKVVFVGAESTGKSTLAERMALEFGTSWVPEYGRVHYEQRGGELDLEDYVTIAQVQRVHEDEAALAAHRYLFIDTNAITTMFFSHYYNRDSLPELRRLADECRTRYQHVIVCDDDITFEQDGWRDNEIWRARMQGMVLHDLAVRGIDYTVVSGTLDDRVEQVKAILGGLGTVPRHRGGTYGPKG